MKRKVCVVTGSRAEYGLLYWLMKEIEEDDDLCLQIIATGAHLSPEFGLTYKEIEKDGFIINEKIEILLSSDTAVGITKTMGLGLIGFAQSYDRLKPDIIVVMGDRFEHFIAVAAAHEARIPVAHLNGGELTEGAKDDAYRHAITKMSHLHFTAMEEYRRRVIQLGESPDRVFTIGEVGLDNIRRLRLLAKDECEEAINFKFNKKNILVTFHPVTLEENSIKNQFLELLCAIDELKDTNIIFTKPNADMGNRVISQITDDYVAKNNGNTAVFTSLGQLRYLSVLQYIDAVVGNSSSGIVEAPSFKIGTINIGSRQKGRMRAESVIDCEPIRQDILNAFAELYSREFQSKLKNIKNPYDKGMASTEMKGIIKTVNLDEITKKKFYDINFEV